MILTALVHKCRDFVSDLWLDLELRFARKPKAGHKTATTLPVAESSSQASGVMSSQPVVSQAAPGMSQLMDQRAQQAEEKKEHVQGAKLSFGLKHLRLNKKLRLAFYDQMSTLIGAGVPLIDALSLIQAQERNKKVQALYATMIHEINGGLSLAESMEIFPHIFPKMQSALVRAAEASGNLKEVLAELVEEMEADQEFYKKITGAMVYPVILLCMAVVLTIGMMTFVIPKIAAMYEQASVELPTLTQAVIGVSDFVVRRWPFLLLGVLVLGFGLYLFFVRLRLGRLLGESMLAYVPILGKIAKEKNLMMIASNMAMLMKSGVLITEAFAITENTIKNLHYQNALEDIRQGVVMGKDVSQMMGLQDIRTQSFIKNKLFPLQVAQLIHIGEKTGTIATMLLKIKKNYHKSIDHTLRNISTLVEPLMIFLVAGLVGTILMAVMLPFFYIGSTIS